MNLQNRKILTDLENIIMVAGVGRKHSSGVWDGHVHTAIFKMDNQQGLLCSTWNSAQCYVAAWMVGGFGGEWIHVYVAESLSCSPETITTLLMCYTSIQNKQ